MWGVMRSPCIKWLRYKSPEENRAPQTVTYMWNWNANYVWRPLLHDERKNKVRNAANQGRDKNDILRYENGQNPSLLWRCEALLSAHLCYISHLQGLHSHPDDSVPLWSSLTCFIFVLNVCYWKSHNRAPVLISEFPAQIVIYNVFLTCTFRHGNE